MVHLEGNPPIVVSEGKQTNPADGTLMADTTAITAAAATGTATASLTVRVEARILVGASVAALWTVQRRNAANAANVGITPTIYTAAGMSGEYILAFTCEPGERLRVVSDGGFTGTGQAVIQAEVLG